jgi:hypothetical protein
VNHLKQITSFSKNSRAYLVLWMLIGIFIIDSAIGKTSGLMINLRTSDILTIVFIAISILYIFGQLLTLNFVKHLLANVKPKRTFSYMAIINKMASAVQYTIVVLLGAVITQVVVTTSYNTVLLISTISVSYLFSAGIISILAEKFFSWFRLSKDRVTFLYGLSSAGLAINVIISLIYLVNILTNFPFVISSNLAHNVTGIPTTFFSRIIVDAFYWSALISFVLIWISTAAIMRHYSNKIGKVRYWILVSIPLVYFLTQFISPFTDLLTQILSKDPIFYGMVFTLAFYFSKLTGGVLFGVAFWTMARSLPRESIVKKYMLLAAYGLILFFVANQNGIVSSGSLYPPLGLITASFLAFSSYLMFSGLYSATISVAEDLSLRRTIRKLAIKELQMLDNIATAQIEHEMEVVVLKITKKQKDAIVEESGIEPSLTMEDAKQYLDEVLIEIKNKKI